jgi:PAS domain S-box-containing protein
MGRLLMMITNIKLTYKRLLSIGKNIFYALLTMLAIPTDTYAQTNSSGVTYQISYNIVVITLLTIIAFLIVIRAREAKILKQLKLRNNQLKIALESTTMGLWKLDLDKKQFTPDKRCLRMLGYKKEDIPCSLDWWLDQIHPDDRQRVKSALDKLSHKTSEKYRQEYRVITKSEQWIWILDRARVIQHNASHHPAIIIGTHVDITSRHQYANDLIRLATIVKQASETIIVTDKKGVIEYVNPSFENKLGYSAREIIGHSPKLFQSGEHDPEFYERMHAVLRHGKIWQGALINKCKNGDTITLETTISPIRNSQAEIMQYLAIGRDVTNETMLENQLRQAQKMEAIGTLAGGIAHDFNNILSAVIGYSELALLDTDSNYTAHHNITEVFKAAKRAADLVSQILTFSRRREYERKPLLLAPVLKEAIKLLRGSLPSTIQINLKIDPNLPPVLADPTQIHQIIMNLCTNAYHAMREHGGILDIRLSAIAFRTEHETGDVTLPPGHYVRMIITDTGSGMTPEIYERIFEPYFTTKNGGDGTGLGLATVHGIVKLHEGAITVKTEPGKGSSFEILLPACVPSAAMDAAESSNKPLPRGNNELILVVDDEEAIVQVLEISLQHLNYRIEAYTSSVKAFEAFEDHPDKYNCIITDQTMPTLTGADFARRVLSRKPQMPIILCSGYSENINAEKAAKLGIAKFIMKPTTSRVLAEAVYNAINNRA